MRYAAIKHLVVPSEQVSQAIHKLEHISANQDDVDVHALNDAIMLLKEYRDICAEVRSE